MSFNLQPFQTLVVASLLMLGGPQYASAQSSSPVGGSTMASKQSQPVRRSSKSHAPSKSAARSEKDKPAAAPQPWQTVDPVRAQMPSGDPNAPQGHKSVETHIGSNDAVTFGGKWNGANDTAEKTRVENYNADAAGTGGEVGFKLHF